MKKLVALLAMALLASACGQSVFALEVGMCFNGDVTASGTVETVECSELHDNEVYALADHPEADDFPGDAVVSEFSEATCLDAFEPYVGISYNESEIFLSTAFPSTETWADGDRETVCLLTSGEEGVQLTGSMKGAAR